MSILIDEKKQGLVVSSVEKSIVLDTRSKVFESDDFTSTTRFLTKEQAVQMATELLIQAQKLGE